MNDTERKTRMLVEITESNHRRLKIVAAKLNRSMAAIVNEAVIDIINKLEKQVDKKDV